MLGVANKPLRLTVIMLNVVASYDELSVIAVANQHRQAGCNLLIKSNAIIMIKPRQVGKQSLVSCVL
jgi:hypothetical protein